MPAKRFPILFITASRLGDAVLASGLIAKLIDEIPGVRFTFVASALTAELFAEVPGLDRIIVMEKQPLGLHWLSLWRQVNAQHWGLIVDLRGSPLSGFLRRSRRAVYRKASGAPMHKVVEAAKLLRLEHEPPQPELYTSAEIESRAAALTAGEGPILAMAPAANWVGKSWPPERFAMVARALVADDGPLAGGRVMVLGGPEDRAAGDPIKATVARTRRIDLAGREGPLVAYAALKRARLFIGNDSGLMHMAAAAGVPTLGLFGPSDEQCYRPWGPQTRIVRGPRDFAEFKAVDPHLNQAICHMLDLTTAKVLKEATNLLAATEGERA